MNHRLVFKTIRYGESNWGNSKRIEVPMQSVSDFH